MSNMSRLSQELKRASELLIIRGPALILHALNMMTAEQQGAFIEAMRIMIQEYDEKKAASQPIVTECPETGQVHEEKATP